MSDVRETPKATKQALPPEQAKNQYVVEKAQHESIDIVGRLSLSEEERRFYAEREQKAIENATRQQDMAFRLECLKVAGQHGTQADHIVSNAAKFYAFVKGEPA